MSQDDKSISSEYVPNQAETYEEWFARQVEIGLREADDPATLWVSNEELFRVVDQRLSDLQFR